MTRVRVLFHLAALIGPFLVIVVWTLLMANGDFREVPEMLGGLSVFVGASLIAAQLAILTCWGMFERRMCGGNRGWPAGVAMSLLTHALFGPVTVVGLIATLGFRSWLGEGHRWSFMTQSLYFSAASLLVAGAVTIPATALLAQWLAYSYRKESSDGVA
jgi:hypothetical protein